MTGVNNLILSPLQITPSDPVDFMGNFTGIAGIRVVDDQYFCSGALQLLFFSAHDGHLLLFATACFLFLDQRDSSLDIFLSRFPLYPILSTRMRQQ